MQHGATPVLPVIERRCCSSRREFQTLRKKVWLAFDAFRFFGTITLGTDRRAPRGGTSTEDVQTVTTSVVKRRCGALEPALSEHPVPNST